ncbi:MAG: hypothetical protein H0T56_16360 [Pseudaminobacter sp.]|nr:hypothetical protein [Pseudaminobacter sp.]
MGRTVSLRAALALVFLLMSALQPGLFASANATGFHSDSGMTLRAKEPVTQAGAHSHAHDDSSAADVAKSEADEKMHHHDSKTLSDQSCDAHCAPANAIPVSCPHVERMAARCPVLAVRDAAIPMGEYNTPVRPPRTLI